MTLTTAILYDGVPGELRSVSIETPSPVEKEVLVRIEGCTLCGSDLHSHSGRRQVIVPTILGHEIVGRIEAFGPASARRDIANQELKVGDRVTWSIVANCGDCHYCKVGLAQKCTAGTKYGHERFTSSGGLVGGLASHCLLTSNTSLIRLPDELPLEVVCPASCATSTIAAAVEAATAPIGQSRLAVSIEEATVLVVGAGLLGLTACAMWAADRAKHVICVEPNAVRRGLANQFGATRAIAPDELDSTVADTTSGRGVDAVIELSGSTRAVESAWKHLRIGGRLVLVGAVFPDSPWQVQMDNIVRRQITIHGVHNYAPWHLQRAVEFLSQHHSDFPFAGLVSQWYPLSEIGTAFQAAHNPDAIRIGVHP